MSRASVEEVVSLIDLVEHALKHSEKVFDNPNAFPLRGILITLGEIKSRVSRGIEAPPHQRASDHLSSTGYSVNEYQDSRSGQSRNEGARSENLHTGQSRADQLHSEFASSAANTSSEYHSKSIHSEPTLPVNARTENVVSESPVAQNFHPEAAPFENVHPEQTQQRYELRNETNEEPSPVKSARGLASRIQMSPASARAPQALASSSVGVSGGTYSNSGTGSATTGTSGGSVREIALTGGTNSGDS